MVTLDRLQFFMVEETYFEKSKCLSIFLQYNPICSFICSVYSWSKISFSNMTKYIASILVFIHYCVALKSRRVCALESTHILVFQQSVLGYLFACPMLHFLQQEVKEDTFNTNLFNVDKGKCTKM